MRLDWSARDSGKMAATPVTGKKSRTCRWTSRVFRERDFGVFEALLMFFVDIGTLVGSVAKEMSNKFLDTQLRPAPFSSRFSTILNSYHKWKCRRLNGVLH